MKSMIKIPTNKPVAIVNCESIEKYLDLVMGEPQHETIAELDEQGLTLITEAYGMTMQLPHNNNLFPFFYVGTCYIVDKELNGLTKEQCEFALRWLYDLNN